MRKMGLLTIGLLASSLLPMADSAHAAALSEAQLDAITAGVGAATGAFGRATGKSTFVATETDTTAGASKSGGFAAGLGVSFALGTGNGATANTNTGIKLTGSGQGYQNSHAQYYTSTHRAYGVSAGVSATVGATQ
jgi:hypothetical protein